MKGKQIVAIDVGSTNVVIAVGAVEDDGRIEILGITSEPVQGVNAGRVENSETVGRAVRAAKERIENQLGIKITEAYAGLSGDFIRCVQVTDHVYVQDDQNNGCNQITERDLESLRLRMQSVKLPDDKEEIISKEPLRYKADNKEVAEPVGAYGHVLTGTYNFILADHTMRERLLHCLLKQDITVKKFVANALVAYLGVATTEDIDEGAVVINLGGGITDVTVLLNGKVRYIASIPMGMDCINGDIRAYGIPSNYVEGLKVNYGSAVHDLTQDDKITFPHIRKGTTKSIRRRNLARIIEERLKEICEWVKREIKEAGCGSRFSPVVLITGGGAEMPNIENLFASELGYDDVRSVYPEYGFTESLNEHITTRAYATVASLLLYGAKIGSCAVATRPVQSNTTEHQPRVTPQINSDGGYSPLQQKPRVTTTTNGDETAHHDVANEHKGDNNAHKGEPVVAPQKIEPVTPVESDNNDDEQIIIDTNGGQSNGNKRSFGRFLEKLGDIFAGKDDEHIDDERII
jgi:cell division protein FtsA